MLRSDWLACGSCCGDDWLVCGRRCVGGVCVCSCVCCVWWRCGEVYVLCVVALWVGVCVVCGGVVGRCMCCVSVCRYVSSITAVRARSPPTGRCVGHYVGWARVGVFVGMGLVWVSLWDGEEHCFLFPKELSSNAPIAIPSPFNPISQDITHYPFHYSPSLGRTQCSPF